MESVAAFAVVERKKEESLWQIWDVLLEYETVDMVR